MSASQGDILDLLHVAVLQRTRDGKVAGWNKAAEALFGWPAADTLHKAAHELIKLRPDSDNASLDEASAALDDTGQWQGNLIAETAGGEEIFVDAHWALAPDGSAVVETYRNITERRRTEMKLRLSEHRYHNLFQAMAASFWELDFSGVDDILRRIYRAGNTDFRKYFRDHPETAREMMRATRVVDVNGETVKLFGRDGNKEELLVNVDPFWPPQSEWDYLNGILSAVEGKLNYSVETKLRSIDGRIFDAHFTACYPPDTMGKGTLLIGVLDLTARNEAFAARDRMRADMAHAARVSMLGELAASIAHEVNQPLAAISTSAEAGLRWLNRPEPNVEEVRALTGRIVADARRAADIVARTRAMASGRPPAPEPLILNDVIKEAARFLQHEMTAHQTELSCKLTPETPQVKADRTQLQQVIINLAVNALQAIGQVPGRRGAVRIVTRPSETGEAEIRVEDNGPGIPADHLDKLFDSFFTTKERGMGMGLQVCRSIIEGCGGSISAGNGAMIGGAVFTIRLPALQA
ncbi:sensor histidine kinase [Gimibacter soli]|uniref:histidine kinase n=1 Tax=Gimibacter soli TaxID=3024400 RepID=A0AAF0BJM4_9PROT|nr:PAS domain-containing sensor histidine kinase [Gimibacter soli]WCL53279.1 ATP-binding protein [Gimibacter soli]